MQDVFSGYGVPITLETPDHFLKVRETLERIGIAGTRDGKNVLYQSAMLLHKRGHYAIMSFKELFALDGKPSSLTEDDVQRRNLIVDLLQQWNLVKVIDPLKIVEKAHISQIKIVPYSERATGNWQFVTKYKIGRK